MSFRSVFIAVVIALLLFPNLVLLGMIGLCRLWVVTRA
jgi:hypothetical protein